MFEPTKNSYMNICILNQKFKLQQENAIREVHVHSNRISDLDWCVPELMIATALNFWKRLLKYLHLLLRSEDLFGTLDARDWNHSSQFERILKNPKRMLSIQTCIRYDQATPKRIKKNIVLEKKNTSPVTKVEYDENRICLPQSLLPARVVWFTRLWGGPMELHQSPVDRNDSSRQWRAHPSQRCISTGSKVAESCRRLELRVLATILVHGRAFVEADW